MAVIKRAETVERFRRRLREVIERSGLSQSGFARKAGIDRSTLSQILSSTSSRLPRVETLMAIATAAHVSLDWLVGLSEEGILAAELLHQSLQIEVGGRSFSDERLERWHAEAIGYKIRHVPTSLPDVLKSEAVIEYEYRASEAVTPEQRVQTSQADLAYHRHPESDVEVSSTQGVAEFARGHGVWAGLAVASRREQLDRMIALTDELYPTFRWFLYDGLRRFSVPMTIFGPKRVAVYVGQRYLVFNSREHIRALTAHFDDLIRAARHQPPETIRYLEDLRAAL